MTADAPPTYSVGELNGAIGSLLERGFAPRFLVQATVSKPQVKKGHLWLTLTDGESSITAVAWASKLKQLNYVPADGEGVIVVGKLNFWAARASLAVQVLDMRPSLSTVLRRFEAVKAQLEAEGLINPLRRRPLPSTPQRVAILTSVPSSALADMLRTARERWPLTELLVVPIPVQGDVAGRINAVLQRLQEAQPTLQADALVLARGGGSREDLMVFDDDSLCRAIAGFPVPVVTGIGHEDDLTVADLVADHRAATPTAAIVSLLPSRETASLLLSDRRRQLTGVLYGWLERHRQRINDRVERWVAITPERLLQQRRNQLVQRQKLLMALSPQRWLSRGFAILESPSGQVIRSIQQINTNDPLVIRLSDGAIHVVAQSTQGSDPVDRPAP